MDLNDINTIRINSYQAPMEQNVERNQAYGWANKYTSVIYTHKSCFTNFELKEPTMCVLIGNIKLSAGLEEYDNSKTNYYHQMN